MFALFIYAFVSIFYLLPFVLAIWAIVSGSKTSSILLTLSVGSVLWYIYEDNMQWNGTRFGSEFDWQSNLPFIIVVIGIPLCIFLLFRAFKKKALS